METTTTTTQAGTNNERVAAAITSDALGLVLQDAVETRAFRELSIALALADGIGDRAAAELNVRELQGRLPRLQAMAEYNVRKRVEFDARTLGSYYGVVSGKAAPAAAWEELADMYERRIARALRRDSKGGRLVQELALLAAAREYQYAHEARANVEAVYEAAKAATRSAYKFRVPAGAFANDKTDYTRVDGFGLTRNGLVYCSVADAFGRFPAKNDRAGAWRLVPSHHVVQWARGASDALDGANRLVRFMLTGAQRGEQITVTLREVTSNSRFRLPLANDTLSPWSAPYDDEVAIAGAPGLPAVCYAESTYDPETGKAEVGSVFVYNPCTGSAYVLSVDPFAVDSYVVPVCVDKARADLGADL